MAQKYRKRRPRSGIRLPLWGLALLISLGLLFLVSSSAWLFRTVQKMASDWQATVPDFGWVAQPAPSTGNNTSTGSTTSPAGSHPIVSAGVLKPWSGTDRVTVLLLGIDQRCGEDDPTRTDSLMLVTVDPVGLSAAVLSIPRDLWVEIPGFGVESINQAHFFGEIYSYPGGGPALAVETVEAAVGAKIDYYVTINFDAFVEVVDLIDGIEVNVAETIDDPDYPDNCYGYDPFYLEAGRQNLDGDTALKFARTRVTLGGDIDRAGRQQQVALAVRDRILQLNKAPQLIARAPELWFTFQENVRTNMTLDEAIQLALLAQDIPGESIRTAVIDYNYVYNETTPSGRQVLVPIRDNIRALRNELFTPPVIPTPKVENLPQMVAQEGARVAVYNGTPVFGLAGATQEYLFGYNVNVTDIGNADSATYRTTQIIDYGTHPNTTLYLTQLLHVPPLNISSGTDPEGDFDILVILGNNWQVPDQ